MGMNIKAKERLVRFDSSKQGEYRYIMQPENYGSIDAVTTKEVTPLSAAAFMNSPFSFSFLVVWALMGDRQPPFHEKITQF